jgi:capsid assembly protease
MSKPYSKIKDLLTKSKQPLIIERNAYESIMAIANDPRIFIEAGKTWTPPAYLNEDPNIVRVDQSENPYIRKVENIGILTLQGPLANDPSCMDEMAGWTSTAAFRNALKIAYFDPAIQKIMIFLNSPGGEVDGTDETAKLIQEISKSKPTNVHIKGMGASGGYWVGAAGQYLTASETAEIGSVGVVFDIYDDSEKRTKEGVKIKSIVSDVSPNKRLDYNTEEGEAEIRTRANDIAKIFIDRISSMRNVSHSHVLEHFGKGSVMIASKALAAGMIDAICTEDEAVIYLKEGKMPDEDKDKKNEDKQKKEEELALDDLEKEEEDELALDDLEEEKDEDKVEEEKEKEEDLEYLNKTAKSSKSATEAVRLAYLRGKKAGINAHHRKVSSMFAKAKAGHGAVLKKHILDKNSTMEAYLSDLLESKSSKASDILSGLNEDSKASNSIGQDGTQEDQALSLDQLGAKFAAEIVGKRR